MYFRILGLALLLVSQLSFAVGRGPAVEDFVGIEVDHVQGPPQGTENLFNFEKDITTFVETKGKPLNSNKTDTSIVASAPSPLMTTVALFFLIGLPMMIWGMVMKNLKQKAHVQSASNIEVLENYRKERQEFKKAQEELKKAS